MEIFPDDYILFQYWGAKNAETTNTSFQYQGNYMKSLCVHLIHWKRKTGKIRNMTMDKKIRECKDKIAEDGKDCTDKSDGQVGLL